MQLVRLPTIECQGLVLAHRQNFSGGSFPKDAVLTADMVMALATAGVADLVCACPEAGDVHEDEVVAYLAPLLSSAHLDFSAAATGRVNIKVPEQGVIRYNRAVIRQINEIDKHITFALEQHNQLLSARQMAATLKVIPFFISESSMRKVEVVFDGAQAFSFHPLRHATVALIGCCNWSSLGFLLLVLNLLTWQLEEF